MAQHKSIDRRKAAKKPTAAAAASTVTQATAAAGREHKTVDRRGAGQKMSVSVQPTTAQNRTPTAGGYYSPRQYGDQADAYAQRVKSAQAVMEERGKTLMSSQEEVQKLRDAAMQAEQAYFNCKGRFQGESAAQYEKQFLDTWTAASRSYAERYQAFEKEYDAYKPFEDAYNAAVGELNAYLDAERNAYDQWRSSIRDAGSIRQERQELKGKEAELVRRMQQANDVAAGVAAPGIQAQAGQNEAQIRQLQTYLGNADERDRLLQEELRYSEYFRFEGNRENEDFAAASAYDPAVQDELYQRINTMGTDPKADAAYQKLNPMAVEQYMTQDEVAMYNYLYKTKGAEGAQEYMDFLRPDLNRQRAEEDTTRMREFAQEHPWAASAVTVVTSPAAGINATAGQLWDMVRGRDVDPNSDYNRMTNMNSALRQTVSENFGPTGSFLYNTGMSMAEMMMDAAVGGPAAMALIGTRSFSGTVIDAKKRGLSNTEAFLLGTSSAAAEVLTERIGLDERLRLPKAWKDEGFWKAAIKAAGGEAAEEGITNIANLTADLAIAGDKSHFRMNVDAYREAGMNDQQAVRRAFGDAGVDLVLDTLGGAISGGVFGGFRKIQSDRAKAKGKDETTDPKPAGVDTLDGPAKPVSPAEGIKPTAAVSDSPATDTTAAATDSGTATEGAGQAGQTAAQGQQTAQEAGNGETYVTARARQAGGEADGALPVRAKDGATLEELKQSAINRRHPLNTGVMHTAEEEELVRRIQNATTKTEITALDNGLGEEETGLLMRLRELTGKEIIVDPANDRYHGFYDVNHDEIHVAADAGDIMTQTFAHELTHTIEKTAGWDSLRRLVRERMTAQGHSWEDLRKEKMRIYEAMGNTLRTADDVDGELVARYIEQNLLTDEASIRQLVADDRSVARRILDWLDSMWAKLPGTTAAKERDFIRKAREAYRTALAEAGERNERRVKRQQMHNAWAEGNEEAGDAAFEDLYRERGSLLEEDEDLDEDGIRFSLKEPVEESRDLLAYHNITAQQLQDVLDRNGLLMPSLAITNKGMTDFGEISLLFDKDTIDPEVSGENKLYGADAWTPQQNMLKKNARFDEEKTEQTVRGIKDNIGSRFAPELFDVTAEQFREAIAGVDGNIFDVYSHHLGMQTAYAMERGVITEIPTGEDGTLDKAALQEQLDRELDTDEGWRQYRRWLRNISDTVIESYDTATNEDILGNMRKQPATAKGFKLSENGELVVPAVEYSSIDEMRSNKNRLSENAEEQTRAVAGEFIALAGRIGSDTKAVVNAINAAFADRYDADGIVRTFGESGIRISERVAAQLQGLYKKAVELPTQYFEGKPHREVGLDEIKAVVMPTGADYAGIKSQMEQLGVSVLEYDGTDASRVEALNSVEDIKFSLKEGSGFAEGRYHDGELAEIEEMRNRESMENDAREERSAWKPVEPEQLSGRVKTEYDRAVRQAAEAVARSLNVPKVAQRDFLQPIAQELAREYMQKGTISAEIRDRLFEEAWNQGIVKEREFYDTYKEVGDYLRTTGVTLSERDRDSQNWEDLRRRASRKVKLQNEGGLPVDTAWQELQEMAPALFPDNIYNPADRLLHMIEVAESIKPEEKTLEDYYGADARYMKQMERMDFDAAVQGAIRELWKVKRLADERIAETTPVAGKDGQALTQEQVTAMYPGLKDARKAMEKAMAKAKLNSQDKKQVQRLLRHDIQPEHLDPSRDNVEDILKVYEAKKAFEEAAEPIREWNRQRKAENLRLAESLLDGVPMKDKKRGWLYSRETMARNIRDIVKDPEAADKIVKTYFDPVRRGSAEATRIQNRYRDRVRALELSRKVKKGDTVSEAYAVQFYGEVSDILQVLKEQESKLKHPNPARLAKRVRDGKTYAEWQAELQKLWEENPGLDKGKIEDAAREFGKIYEELFEKMNEVRVRNGYEPINHRSGYFPHFQQQGRDGVLAQFGKALGIDTEVQQLPTTINGLTHTFKPGIRWFGNALERKGFDTAYDAVEGFDRYIVGASDVICHTDNIQRLRALATQIRYRTGDEGLREQIRKIQEKTDLSEDEKDALIREKYQNGKFELSNFVVELDEYTNLLANKKSRADRNMEQAMGRDMYNVIKSMESRVAANMVAINPGSWLTNFIPITQGWASLDTRTLLKGMRDTVAALKDDDGMVDRSDFLTGRKGTDPLVQTWSQMWGNKLSTPMSWIDGFTAGTLVRARYAQNIRNGLSESEAVSEADEWTAGVMADRTKGAMPTVFHRNNPPTKLFTQFQLEVNNQLSFVYKDLPREKRDKAGKELALALLKFAIGAWLYNEAYEHFLGRRPALDVADVAFGFAGDVIDPELDLADAMMGAGEKIAENTPFIGGLLGGGRVPISSALPSVQNLVKAVGNKEWSAEKRLATAAKELTKPAAYILPPFGGGQAKKAWEGLRMIHEGGKYTVDAEGNPLLQYPLHSTDSAIQKALEAGQAMVFGPTTLRSGRKWVEGGFGNLSADQTAAYQALIEMDVEQADAFKLLNDLRGAKKDGDRSESAVRRDVLRNSGLEGDALAVVYYDVMVTDGSREQAVIGALQEKEANMGRVANCLMDLKDAGNTADKYRVLRGSGLSGEEMTEIYYGMILDEGSKEQALMDSLRKGGADMGKVTGCLLGIKAADAELKGSAASNAKRDAIMASGLTDAQKREIYRDRISETRDDDIDAFKAAGLGMNDFLEVQNAYADIDGKYEDEGDKATAFARWVNKQDFTEEQKATARECFRY